MFWKFNLLSSSHIDTLLEKEDVTLQELMDEDDILQECKARHKKLIDFLIRPENLEEMINMVTQEPSEEIEEKLRYKYPNTSCEVLTCDVTQINDKLAGDVMYINKLYAFLESEKPLNPLLASFVSKVMGLLIARKSEMIFEYLKSKDDFVGTLLNHIGTSAIMDLLLRLITCIESPELRTDVIQWLNEEHLVEKLVDRILPSTDEDIHGNAAQSLCDIVRLGREQMSQLQEKAEPDPLLASIESEVTVRQLLYNILDGEKNESTIVNGLLVIQTLLDVKKQGFEGEIDQRTQLDVERLAQGISNVLTAVTPRIKDLHSILQNPPKQRYCSMPTTAGVLEPPLGNTRLQISKLIAALVLTNTHSVNVELANSGTINVLLDLYFKYVWNNFLHTHVEQCINIILNNTPTEVDGRKEHPLIAKIFIECRLIQRILDSWEENDQHQNRAGGRRRGYMGHLTKIANHIVQCLEKGDNSELIKEQFNEISEEYGQRWNTFASGILADINKKNTIELVQGHPLHSSSEDDDADFRDLPFPQDTVMQQAFSDYQLQQMTTNFIDQFGFNEDDFGEQEGKLDAVFSEKISSIDFNIRADEDSVPNASMFEQACNERIQQFDENDSDEDIWAKKEVTPIFCSSPGRRPGLSDETKVSDDDSTDSDEELDSPKRIVQQPRTENMDVDATESWPAAFDEVPMDAAPVAMDTASPWDGTQVSGEPHQKWTAAFDGKMSQAGDEGWADFSNFNSSNLSSTRPGPRSSSPIAMDTGDSNSRPNSSTYLLEPDPSSVVHEEEIKKSEKRQSTENSWNTELSDKRGVSIKSSQAVNSAGVEADSMKDAGNQADSDDENSLSKDDGFLAAVGLIKSGAAGEPQVPLSPDRKQQPASPESSSTVLLEEVRYQAKEAMENYDKAVTDPTSTLQNGPI